MPSVSPQHPLNFVTSQNPFCEGTETSGWPRRSPAGSPAQPLALSWDSDSFETVPGEATWIFYL